MLVLMPKNIIITNAKKNCQKYRKMTMKSVHKTAVVEPSFLLFMNERVCFFLFLNNSLMGIIVS